MTLLILFSFLAGIVTILSPCILPVLPIILSVSADARGKKKPVGVITGFVLSFTFFTLFLSTIVRATGVPAEVLRLASVVIIAGFGIVLIVPKIQAKIEILFSKLSKFSPNPTAHKGFFGGVLIGFSLGLLWTPCVGPILASVISLAIIGEVTFGAFLIILAYSIGTAISMFLIMLGGAKFLPRSKWIQPVFGILMILTAFAIFTNLDRKFQTYVLNKFPQYGAGLTKLEDQEFIRKELGDMTTSSVTAPELIPGGQWFNSEPLTLAGLRGKVVLVDFWTYTCINCQRTLPYLASWWEKYKDSGLVIIGVHSPEFEFEKDPENVKEAMADFGVLYPVMQDNNFATWRAYNNRYWPAKYLIDKDGHIRYTHFEEGDYDETEAMIQELLQVTEVVNNPEYTIYARTPETYLGYERMAGFASPEKLQKDRISSYTIPSNLPANKFAFEGDWLVLGEYSNPQAGSKLQLNFESKQVFLVMNPKEGSSTVRVLLDGVEVGVVTVDSDQLYTLVELEEPGRHILQLEFEDNNVEVYAFTFG